MRQRRYPVLVDTPQGHFRAGFSAPEDEDRAGISLKVRDRGWLVYRVRFEPDQGAWVVSVMNTRRAA